MLARSDPSTLVDSKSISPSIGFHSHNLPVGVAIRWLDLPVAPALLALGLYGMIAMWAAILILIMARWWHSRSSSPTAPLPQQANGNNVQEKESHPYSVKVHKNRGLLLLGFVSIGTLSLGHLSHVSHLVPYDYFLILAAEFRVMMYSIPYTS